MTETSCDGCDLCCIVFNIPELKKPGYKPCQHLCPAGCAIHGKRRPDACETFLCAYRAGLQLRHPKDCGFLVNCLDGVMRIMESPKGVDHEYLEATIRFWRDDVRATVERSSACFQTLHVPGTKAKAVRIRTSPADEQPFAYQTADVYGMPAVTLIGWEFSGSYSVTEQFDFLAKLEESHRRIADQFSDTLIAYLRRRGYVKMDQITAEAAACGNRLAWNTLTSAAVGDRRV